MTETASHEPAQDAAHEPARESVPATATVPPRRRGGALAVLLALAALGCAGWALWQVEQLSRADDTGAAALDAARHELRQRLDAIGQQLDQRGRELDSLRTRSADAERVNRGLREELLGLGERSRHLEDAVANLAERGQAGRDALALDEAEFLLQMSAERLRLFHDGEGALLAYGLADSALATAQDPLFASLRQTLAAERDALQRMRPVESRAALSTLAQARRVLAGLPAAAAAAADGASPAASRPPAWQRWLSGFIRIHHEDAQAAPAAIGPELALARSLAELDLRLAEAALLARDESAWQAALDSAHAGIGRHFDTRAGAGRALLDELAALRQQELAPEPPELGTALRELRNLRATRLLARPVPGDMPPRAPDPAGDRPAPAGLPAGDGTGPETAVPAQGGEDELGDET